MQKSMIFPSPDKDMDPLREAHECAVGLNFIAWYNRKHGTEFRYDGRAEESPPLVFRSDGQELRGDVVTAYFDAHHGRFKWRGERHPLQHHRYQKTTEFHRRFLKFI